MENFLKLLIVSIILAVSSTAVVAQDSDTGKAFVEIADGELAGKTGKSRKGREFYQFLGIPYGQAKRFEISYPSPSWRETGKPRDALEYAPPCTQIDEFSRKTTGVEDCLFLNVFTPQLPTSNSRRNTAKLPVIFAIHCGGFTMGNTGQLRPEYLIDQDVILVTAAYRLGPLGFLNAGTAKARGNQGLKDLVLALKWVRDNIERFGGDRNKVTIQGSSSSSYAVGHLIVSPMAKGLFSSAISSSGSSLCPWTRQFKPGMAWENVKKLGQMVDCPTSNPDYLVKCLGRLETSVLLEATLSPDFVFFNISQPSFGPSLETFKDSSVENDTASVFLDEDPYGILLRGDFDPVPYILGYTSQEGLLFSGALVLSYDNLTSQINSEWGRVAPNTFGYSEYAKDACDVSGKIRSFYFGSGDNAQNITRSNAPALIDAYADRWVHKCTRDFALLYSKTAPLYLYNFTRKGAHSILDFVQWYDPQETQKPPSHLDESQYLFNGNEEMYPDIWTNSTDFQFSDRFASLWASFARTGKPYCDWCNAREWTRVSSPENTSEPLSYLQIDERPEMKGETTDFLKRMAFWESLDIKEYFPGTGRQTQEGIMGSRRGRVLDTEALQDHRTTETTTTTTAPAFTPSRRQGISQTYVHATATPSTPSTTRRPQIQPTRIGSGSGSQEPTNTNAGCRYTECNGYGNCFSECNATDVDVTSGYDPSDSGSDGSGGYGGYEYESRPRAPVNSTSGTYGVRGNSLSDYYRNPNTTTTTTTSTTITTTTTTARPQVTEESTDSTQMPLPIRPITIQNLEIQNLESEIENPQNQNQNPQWSQINSNSSVNRVELQLSFILRLFFPQLNVTQEVEMRRVNFTNAA